METGSVTMEKTIGAFEVRRKFGKIIQEVLTK
jgi:hypothetical protein